MFLKTNGRDVTDFVSPRAPPTMAIDNGNLVLNSWLDKVGTLVTLVEIQETLSRWING